MIGSDASRRNAWLTSGARYNMFDRPGGPKVLLSLFQIASGVGFEIGLIATQSVLADVIGAGVMVRVRMPA